MMTKKALRLLGWIAAPFTFAASLFQSIASAFERGALAEAATDQAVELVEWNWWN
ncbi:MAG TPA: hypothetical protein VFJ18_12675 [Pararhizobium sp.]|nr:hypothetical protein [Pararhizobium sp.]